MDTKENRRLIQAAGMTRKCPVCEAKKGHWCTTGSGGTAKRLHRWRRSEGLIDVLDEKTRGASNGGRPMTTQDRLQKIRKDLDFAKYAVGALGADHVSQHGEWLVSGDHSKRLYWVMRGEVERLVARRDRLMGASKGVDA